jgi:hypothetical protein
MLEYKRGPEIGAPFAVVLKFLLFAAVQKQCRQRSNGTGTEVALTDGITKI